MQNLLFNPTTPPIANCLVLPNYFKFMFCLLDFDNKGYICEHDLFLIMKIFRESKKVLPDLPQLKDFIEEDNQAFCPYIDALADDCIAVSRGLTFPVKARAIKRQPTVKIQNESKLTKTVNKATFGEKTKKRPTKS